MRLWIWRHLRVELPDNWEMLQFSRDPAAGRCGFADRYQYRLELDWRAAASRPDVTRMMGDYLAKVRLDGTMPDAAPTRVGDWQGFTGRQDDLLTSRFARHVAQERCVVEVVFLWPQARDGDLEEAVLASVAPEPEHGGLRRWRAFGMDLLASGGLPLRECVVQPARARMVFGEERGRREETFQRLGMVEQWLRGSAGEWLARQSPRDVVRSSAWPERQGAHDIALVSGTRRPGLLRRARRYDAAAWICPNDGRLYCVTTTGLEAPALRLAGGRLSCCGELELAL